MTQVETLADQLERTFRGGAWHGPSVSEALEGVDAQVAIAKSPGGHCIWDIVQHLVVWNDVPRRRLDGDRLLNLPEEVSWPPLTATTPAAWQEARATLAQAHAAFHARVLRLSDEQLDDAVAGSDPTVRGLLLGVLQHNAYHAGQIAILRRTHGTSR